MTQISVQFGLFIVVPDYHLLPMPHTCVVVTEVSSSYSSRTDTMLFLGTQIGRFSYIAFIDMYNLIQCSCIYMCWEHRSLGTHTPVTGRPTRTFHLTHRWYRGGVF